MRHAPSIALTKTERQQLLQWIATSGSRDRAVRAQVMLLAAAGFENRLIAAEVDLSPRQVGTIRRSFAARGIRAIAVTPQRWSRAPVPPLLVNEVVRRTLEETPTSGARWSTRTMGELMGLSANTISRIWRACGIKPHAAAPSALRYRR